MSFNKLEINMLRDAGIVREVFTHLTLGTFDVRQMRENILRRIEEGRPPPLHRCRYDNMKMVDGRPMDILAYLMENREVDLKRCELFTTEELEDPLIYVLCPPGANGEGLSHLLVDGIHRLIERQRRGLPDFMFYMIRIEDAVRINIRDHMEILWGEKDVVPGVGVVKRKG